MLICCYCTEQFKSRTCFLSETSCGILHLPKCNHGHKVKVRYKPSSASQSQNKCLFPTFSAQIGLHIFVLKIFDVFETNQLTKNVRLAVNDVVQGMNGYAPLSVTDVEDVLVEELWERLLYRRRLLFYF